MHSFYLGVQSDAYRCATTVIGSCNQRCAQKFVMGRALVSLSKNDKDTFNLGAFEAYFPGKILSIILKNMHFLAF